MDPILALAGLGVGIVVGLTGMGGGVLIGARLSSRAPNAVVRAALN